MTTPQTHLPALWPPKTILSDWDDERLARALRDAEVESKWIDDFIERLRYTIEDIDRKK